MRGLFKNGSGSDLLFHTVASAVSSAYWGLTSVFGMGTGGSPKPLPPETPQVGIEPTTLRLTAECSTAELLRIAANQNSVLIWLSDLFRSIANARNSINLQGIRIRAHVTLANILKPHSLPYCES